MNAGELIKSKRKEKGLTLQNVADYLGCSKMAVSKYERGQIQNLKRDKLIALSKLLEVSPIELIDCVEIEQEITVNGFKTQVNYLLHQTKDLSEMEKDLIRNYINLICNKGK